MKHVLRTRIVGVMVALFETIAAADARAVVELPTDGGPPLVRNSLSSGATDQNLALVDGDSLQSLEPGGTRVTAPNDCRLSLADGGAPKECWQLKVTQDQHVATLRDGGTVSFTLKLEGSGTQAKVTNQENLIATAFATAWKDFAKFEGEAGHPRAVYEETWGWETDIAIVVYDALGRPLFGTPRVDEDDQVIVVVVGDKDHTIESARLSKCEIPKAVRIGGGSLPASFLKGDERTAESNFAIVVAERCSADDGIEVAVSVKEAATTTPAKEIKIVLSTLPLYRLTVGLGFLFDFTTVTDYRTSGLKGESAPIIVQDSHWAGVTPTAFVSFRLCKVDANRNRFWEGELTGTKFLLGLCRVLLNASFGLSLSKPEEHLYFAMNIEPYPGLGLLWGGHVLQKPTLAGGYAVGDRFSGGSEVPVDRRWTAGGFFVGVLFDSTLLAKLLLALNL